MRSDAPILCPKCDCIQIHHLSAFTMPKYIPVNEPIDITGKYFYKPEHLLYTCITCGFEIETRCKDATNEQWATYDGLHP